MQAGNEMGCVFFCKKSGKWGLAFLVKKWKMGVFFVKKSGPFLNAGCIMYSIGIFYFTFYLFGGMRTLPMYPPAYRPGNSSLSSVT